MLNRRVHEEGKVMTGVRVRELRGQWVKYMEHKPDEEWKLTLRERMKELDSIQ